MIKIVHTSLLRNMALTASGAWSPRPASTFKPTSRQQGTSFQGWQLNHNLSPAIFLPTIATVRHLSSTTILFSPDQAAVQAATAAAVLQSTPAAAAEPVSKLPSEAVAADSAVEVVPSSQAGEAVANATTTTPVETAVLDFLPEKPVPTGASSGGVFEYGHGIDPPLDVMGLGSWWPSGRVQVILDYLHTGLDLPWWGSILIATIGMRVMVFPIVIRAQKNMANLLNNSEKMQDFQERMTDARNRGDQLEAMKVGKAMLAFQEQKGINPLKNIWPLVAQGTIFATMVIGLRGLANLPMESMESGGLGWFVNLTVADPYYALPLMTSATTYIMMKLGADGMTPPNERANPLLKYGIRALPILLLPITINFASAITYYWFINNIISLSQARVIRSPYLRKQLRIPQIKKPKKKSPASNKGFMENIRESMDNMRINLDMVDKGHYETAKSNQNQAKRTYKFDPNKAKPKLKK